MTSGADVDGAVAPVPSGATVGRITASDGIGLRWLEWGGPDAPPLVLLHGLRSYAATFAPLAAALGTRWRCLAVDARGRGGSDWDPHRNYHTDRYVADLAELVEAWGLRRFALLGHSMGGSTAFVYAAAHPERVAALVIEDILPGSSLAGDGADRIRREVRSTPVDFASREEAEAYWRRLRPAATAAALDSRLEHTVVRDEGSGRWRWIADMAGIAEARLDEERPPVDLWPAVRGVQCPTLVIRGGDSDFSPPEVMARVHAQNPNVDGVTVAAAGHYVHDDQPEEFTRVVSAFLEGCR